MNHTKTAAGAFVAAVASLALAASPAWAQAGDLDCGDPGTFHNMPVGPDDPHRLDSNGDGIGCEDASAFGPDGQPVGTPVATDPPPVTEPAAPAPTDPAPVMEAPAPVEAPPAAPVVEEPDYTG